MTMTIITSMSMSTIIITMSTATADVTMTIITSIMSTSIMSTSTITMNTAKNAPADADTIITTIMLTRYSEAGVPRAPVHTRKRRSQISLKRLRTRPSTAWFSVPRVSYPARTAALGSTSTTYPGRQTYAVAALTLRVASA